MRTITAQDGDTWESIAKVYFVPLSSLLMANGLDPNICDAPPDPGSTVALPDPPPPVAAAPGEDHCLDVPPQSCVWVRLDMTPHEAASTGDSVRLYDDDGTHDVTLAIADHFTPHGKVVDLLFDAVDPSLSYSVEYRTEAAEPTPIVSSTPFSELDDDSLPAGQASTSHSYSSPEDGLGDRSLPPISPPNLIAGNDPSNSDASG